MRRGRRTALVATTAALAALLAGAVLHPAAADPFGPSGTVTVTPSSQNQFAGTFDRGAGSRTFTDRFGAPPEGGAGALELRTPADDDRVQFVTDEVAGPLERFSSSSYWAFRDPASGTGSMPSFQIATDVDGGDLEARELYLLTYLPGPAPAGRWTRYDVGSGTFCVTRQTASVDAYRECADGAPQRSLDEITAEFPDMTAYAAGINQGAGQAELVSAVDLLRVGRRTYDLEPR